MEFVVGFFAFLGLFFTYICIMSGVDRLKLVRKNKKSVEPPKSLDILEQRELDKSLELMDPWYPNHDNWLDYEDSLDLKEIEKDDPIEYIQIKLVLWMQHQRMSVFDRNWENTISRQLERADHYAKKSELDYISRVTNDQCDCC